MECGVGCRMLASLIFFPFFVRGGNVGLCGRVIRGWDGWKGGCSHG